MSSSEGAPPPDLVHLANSLVLKNPPLPLVPLPDAPGFIVALDKSLTALNSRRELLLPDLHQHAQTIAVFSDYAGDQGRYRTYSFMIVGWDALGACVANFNATRQKHGLNEPYKEIAFKSIGYGPQDRALDELLFSAELAPGLLFTLVVEESIHSIVREDSRKSHGEFQSLLKKEGLGEWKGAVAERLLRIVHAVAYLVGLLARDGQNVLWMTDHDPIVANDDKVKALGALLGRVLRLYGRRSYGIVSYALPLPPAGGLPDLRDLLSIADLAAGSIAQHHTAVAASNDPKIKEGANKVLMWLSRQGVMLKRLNFALRKSTSGQIVAAVQQLVPKKAELQPIVEIPIDMGRGPK